MVKYVLETYTTEEGIGNQDAETMRFPKLLITTPFWVH